MSMFENLSAELNSYASTSDLEASLFSQEGIEDLYPSNTMAPSGLESKHDYLNELTEGSKKNKEIDLYRFLSYVMPQKR